MKVWLDAQLSPGIARWLRDSMGLDAVAVRDVGLRDASDAEIWTAAARADAVLMSKDRDFADRAIRLGPPPMVIWLSLGNTSNAHLRAVLASALPAALGLLGRGEKLVEIGDSR